MPDEARSMSTYSVLLASRNEGSRLRQTVDSVFCNPPANAGIEVVIVDDASDDASAGFVADEACSEWPIHVLRNGTRQGVIRSRALATEFARGEYLVFLDAHCAVTPGWLEGLAAELQRIDNRGLAAPAIYRLRSDWTIDYPRGGVTAGTISSPFLDFEWTQPRLVDGRSCACVIGGGAWMCSAEWYRHVGGLDKKMRIWGMENIDFPLRTWAAGGWCLAVEAVHVGHVFNESPAPIMRDVDFVYNKLRAVHNVFSADTFPRIMKSLAYLVGFREALQQLYDERESLNPFKDYIESIRQRSDAWLIETFHLPLLDDPERYLSADSRPGAAAT
jgi:polypeptide N-acetylgalactosaminyltransferase